MRFERFLLALVLRASIKMSELASRSKSRSRPSEKNSNWIDGLVGSEVVVCLSIRWRARSVVARVT